MRNPPSLLSLAIDSALLNNLSCFSDLSSIPDHILIDLFIVSSAYVSLSLCVLLFIDYVLNSFALIWKLVSRLIN